MMRQNHGIRCNRAALNAVGVNVLIQNGRLLVFNDLVPPDFDAAATANQLFHLMVWQAYLSAIDRLEIIFVALDVIPWCKVFHRCALGPMSRFSILAVFAGHPSQFNQIGVQLGVISIAQLLSFGFQIAINLAAPPRRIGDSGLQRNIRILVLYGVPVISPKPASRPTN